jgi:hypothetical protein
VVAVAKHRSSPQEPGTQPDASGPRPATGGRHRAYDARHRSVGPDGLSVWATAQATGPVQRKGRYVADDSACASTSGRWYSPYDGATWTAASDVDIDHIVPLAEAWRSGANS